MIRADCITYVSTLRNTIRAMKRELGLSYQQRSWWTWCKQLLLLPLHCRQDASQHKRGTQEMVRPSWNYFYLLPERWFVLIMLISVTSEVAWIEIYVARITRPTIRHKKGYNLNLTLPFKPYPLPPIPHPRNSHGAIFDRECERILLVRVMGRRFTVVFRLPHIIQKWPLTPPFWAAMLMAQNRDKSIF